jgi:hypothetical protein
VITVITFVTVSVLKSFPTNSVTVITRTPDKLSRTPSPVQQFFPRVYNMIICLTQMTSRQNNYMHDRALPFYGVAKSARVYDKLRIQLNFIT